jgi:hypothetical protein
MTVLPITILDKGESDDTKLPEGTKVVYGELDHVWIMNDGTESGKPAVMLRTKLPDGTLVLCQTTGNMFNMAAGALRGACQRWGHKL